MPTASSNDRLLLLACSARKRPARSEVPALSLYDGPAYRSVRKLIRSDSFPRDVTIRVVSAKHGLLGPDDAIATYDRRIDPARDAALIAATQRALAALGRRAGPREVFCFLSRDYQACLPPAWRTAGGSTRLTFASGPPGQRVRQMLDWLNNGGMPCS